MFSICAGLHYALIKTTRFLCLMQSNSQENNYLQRRGENKAFLVQQHNESQDTSGLGMKSCGRQLNNSSERVSKLLTSERTHLCCGTRAGPPPAPTLCNTRGRAGPATRLQNYHVLCLSRACKLSYLTLSNHSSFCGNKFDTNNIFRINTLSLWPLIPCTTQTSLQSPHFPRLVLQLHCNVLN